MDKLKTEKINRKTKNLYLPWTFELADVFYLVIPKRVTDEAVHNIASGRGSCPLSIAAIA